MPIPVLSVTFDNEELVTSEYLPRIFQHENPAEKFINSVDLPREDGQVFVSTRRGAKIITVNGILTAADLEALETAIQEFKELFSREQRQLVFTRADGLTTISYTATCRRHTFDRDHFHLNYVPWSAEFIVPEGIGYGAGTETEGPASDFNAQDEPTDVDFEMVGYKGPKPKITVTVGNPSWDQATGVMLRNKDTGEKIIITQDGSWEEGDTVVIDCDKKKVTSNVDYAAQREVDFYGVFPSFRSEFDGDGVSHFEIQAGCIPIQETVVEDPTALGDSMDLISHMIWMAQSFVVPYDDATFRSVALVVSKVGSPAPFHIEVQEDDGGKPKGVPIVQFLAGGDGADGTPKWITHVHPYEQFELKANTRYWIVCYQDDEPLTGSDYWRIHMLVPGTYELGSVAWSDDIGSTWTYYEGKDLAFRIEAGGGGTEAQVNVEIEYKPVFL